MNNFFNQYIMRDHDVRKNSAPHNRKTQVRKTDSPKPGTNISSVHAAKAVSSPARPEEKTAAAVPPADNENLLSFESDDLIKGIILSEILGKPKGRRTGWW